MFYIGTRINDASALAEFFYITSRTQFRRQSPTSSCNREITVSEIRNEFRAHSLNRLLHSQIVVITNYQRFSRSIVSLVRRYSTILSPFRLFIGDNKLEYTLCTSCTPERFIPMLRTGAVMDHEMRATLTVYKPKLRVLEWNHASLTLTLPTDNRVHLANEWHSRGGRLVLSPSRFYCYISVFCLQNFVRAANIEEYAFLACISCERSGEFAGLHITKFDT